MIVVDQIVFHYSIHPMIKRQLMRKIIRVPQVMAEVVRSPSSHSNDLEPCRATVPPTKGTGGVVSFSVLLRELEE